MHIANRVRIFRAIADGALLMLLYRPTFANRYVLEGAGLGRPVMSAALAGPEPRSDWIYYCGKWMLANGSASGGEGSGLIVQLLRAADEPGTILVMGSGLFLLSRYLRNRRAKKAALPANRSAADGKAEIVGLV
jgi:hypothetical protein